MATVTLPRGTTLGLPLAFTAGGSAMNLTGLTLEVFETHPASILSGATITVTNAAGGLATLNWTWDSAAIPLTDSYAKFAIRIVGGLGFPPIEVAFE